MDKNYFNPSKYNKIYVRNSEFYLRGKISDKGGFNWELRVNESVVDNYLIYGDLHIDNTRDFNVKLNVKDGDIMDWGMKDYKANGFPDKVTDMDGNVYLQTGYSDLNAKAVGVHYQFLYDNVKPEVNIDPEGNTSIEYADGKSVVFNINDKRDNGFNGEIQDKHIYVNGKEYKSFDDIKQLTDKTLNIKILVKDFARNTTVKEFILNKDTGEVSELKPHTVTVTIQNGKEMSSKIVSEEDFILPVYEGELEKGYQFDGWEISGFEGKKDAGYVINVSKDTLIKPVFKKIEEKKEEENKPTFDVSKKKDKVQANHSQLDENYKKEDLQRENPSHKSDSTEGITATVPVQVNYSQLDESQRSDSTEDVKVTVPDENKKEVYLNEPENIANKHTNIDSKSDTNHSDRLPKTGTVSEVFTSLVAGIMFTLGAFLGLKKKDQD